MDSEEGEQRLRKLTAELGERDAKIKERDRKITKLAAEVRRLTSLLGDRDSRLRKLSSELATCDATIRLFTVELGERHTKIGELSAALEDCNRRIRQHAAELEARDQKLWENEAEIGRLQELLEEQEKEFCQMRAELENRELEAQREEQRVDLSGQEQIAELAAELECRAQRIEELVAELGKQEVLLQEYEGKIRKCIQEHRKEEEEKMANVTLDPDTAHPRLLLSPDQKSVRWEYLLEGPSPDSPHRFDADPCVLGREAFTSGRHWWVVDLAHGQYCAVGVSKESLQRKGPITFKPEEGIWAVQQWGFKNRALTSPPTLLDLPRVPKKIRISLDYEWGEVTFFDVENQSPIFSFPPTSFGGERIRPWFWVELGSLSLVR